MELSTPSISATLQWQLSVERTVWNNAFIHNECSSHNTIGLKQDFSISIANTREIQLSFTETLICPIRYAHIFVQHCFVADISTKSKCNSTMTAVCLITHCFIVFLQTDIPITTPDSGHNGHKPKRPKPKRPQTETATNRNGHKPKRPQTGTATDRNGHRPKRPQTETATNRNGHKPERPQTETATNRNRHNYNYSAGYKFVCSIEVSN